MTFLTNFILISDGFLLLLLNQVQIDFQLIQKIQIDFQFIQNNTHNLNWTGIMESTTVFVSTVSTQHHAQETHIHFMSGCKLFSCRAKLVINKYFHIQ